MTAIQYLKAALEAAQIDLRNARNGAECDGDFITEAVIERAIFTAVDAIVAFDESYQDTFEMPPRRNNTKVNKLERLLVEELGKKEFDCLKVDRLRMELQNAQRDLEVPF